MATVAICASMTFIDAVEELAVRLIERGHTVHTPHREEVAVNWAALTEGEALSRKRGYIDRHLDLIRASDVVLVANYDKHSVSGYVGANTLMESAFAHALNLPVVLLFQLGEQPCQLELASITHSVLGGDLDALLLHLNGANS
ncbi:hypothetical protein [Devosia geojensis]|nr:hypothetical protein [Devosia geojensis]